MVTVDDAKVTLQKNQENLKNWISNETFEWIKWKLEAKTRSQSEYKTLRGELQQRLRKDKLEELETLYRELEEKKKGNGRTVLKTVKWLTGLYYGN